MDTPALIALLTFWSLTGLLPRFFFKSGKLNLGWWLTALPMNAAPLLLLIAAFGVYHPLTPHGWQTGLGIASVILTLAAVGLMFFTLGTHRVPLALFHQQDDAPVHIVTYGAYSRIRHPFYASFLLGLTSTVVLLPHWLTAIVLAYGIWRFNATAAREERRLSSSEFGAEYRAYTLKAGRFAPRLTARSAPVAAEAAGLTAAAPR
jgi:protein-S-isoprenylcysteine O-methyltransferase Ste14